MLLTHNLSTIELGSISWRQVINQNFVYLDNNRIFIVNTDVDLPNSNFKANRFFYSIDSKKLFFDNGTLIVELSGGSSGLDIDYAANADKFIKINAAGTTLEFIDKTLILEEIGGTFIDITNNANKYLKVNSAGTALEYVTINALVNNSTKSQTIAITKLDSMNEVDYSTALGYSVESSNNSVVIGYNAKGKSSNKSIVIGNETYLENSQNSIILGSNTYNYGGVYSIALGSYITDATYNNSIIFGHGGKGKHQSIALGNYVSPKNSRSFTTQIIENSKTFSSKIVLQNSLNTNYLTQIYVNNSNEKVYIPSETLYTINYKVIFQNESNYKCKIVSGKYIAYQELYQNFEKLFTKNIDFEDVDYANADFDFNNANGYLEVLVNTNSIFTKVTVILDIEYI